MTWNVRTTPETGAVNYLDLCGTNTRLNPEVNWAPARGTAIASPFSTFHVLRNFFISQDCFADHIAEQSGLLDFVNIIKMKCRNSKFKIYFTIIFNLL